MRIGQWIFDCTWSTKLPMMNLIVRSAPWTIHLTQCYVPFPAREITTTHNETNWWIRFNILNEHLTRACWSWYEQQILHIIKSSIIKHLFDLFQSFVELGFKLSIASVNWSRLIQHEYLWFQIIHASFIHSRIDIPIFFIVSHSMNCINI